MVQHQEIVIFLTKSNKDHYCQHVAVGYLQKVPSKENDLLDKFLEQQKNKPPTQHLKTQRKCLWANFYFHSCFFFGAFQILVCFFVV